MMELLFVKTGHLLVFNFNNSGLLADINAIKELPDVLLPDRGGLLDQGRWRGKRKGQVWEQGMREWHMLSGG